MPKPTYGAFANILAVVFGFSIAGCAVLSIARVRQAVSLGGARAIVGAFSDFLTIPFFTEVHVTDVLLTVFTGLLVFVGTWQGFHLRRTVEATEASARAAESTIATMQSNAETQMRAYVRLDHQSSGFMPAVDAPLETIITYENYGLTPARNVAVSVFVDLYEGPDLVPILSGPSSSGLPTTAALHPNIKLQALARGEVKLTATDMNDVRAGKKMMILGGRVWYQDMFSERQRFTNFAMVWKPDTRQWDLSITGNDFD